MALEVGALLGPYRVTGLLGKGGMGEVFSAHDAALNRDVALKVLPDIFAADPDRLARFGREAQALASLNHPNIAQIYGVEHSGGVHALVMELVDGPTLAEVIAMAVDHAPSGSEARQAVGTALSPVPAAGGTPEPLLPADPSRRSYVRPEFLPGGRAVLFDVGPAGSSAEGREIDVVALDTKAVKRVISGGTQPRYAASGHLLYVSDGVLNAIRFDLNRLDTSGTPVPVLSEGMRTKNGNSSADFSISPAGTLAYVQGTGGGQRTLAWVDRAGRDTIR